MFKERPIIDAEQERGFESGPGADKHASPARINSSAVLIVVLVASAGALIAFGAVPRMFQQRALVEHSRAQADGIIPVSYTVAEAGPEVEEFVLPGSTQPIVDAPIYSRVDGYLSKLYVNIGDRVHTGQVLAEIDTPELDKQVQAATNNVEQTKANLDNATEALGKARADARTAVANVQKAKSDLVYAQIEINRYTELAKEGAASIEDKDTRLSNFRGAEATLQAAVSGQNSAEQAIKSATAAVHVAKAAVDGATSQRDQYEATRSFKKVKAQFDGIVTKRNVDPGALVTSGSSSNNSVLFQIAKTDPLRIMAYVPEQYIAQLQGGEKAKLTFQTFPGKEFIGTVAYVAGGLDPASRTLQVEIHVPNQDHRLLPGMYSQVHFQLASHTRLPIIPASATQTGSDSTYLYTVDDQNRVHMHKVQIGRDLGGKVEIAKGLAVGEKVIVSPADDIQDGILVNPIVAPTPRSAQAEK